MNPLKQIKKDNRLLELDPPVMVEITKTDENEYLIECQELELSRWEETPELALYVMSRDIMEMWDDYLEESYQAFLPPVMTIPQKHLAKIGTETVV